MIFLHWILEDKIEWIMLSILSSNIQCKIDKIDNIIKKSKCNTNIRTKSR